MNHSIDGIKETFKILVAQGHTPYEAYQMFDSSDFWRAAIEEMHERGHYDTIIDDESLMSLGSFAQREEMDRKDMEEQAIPLWLAGWKSEPQSRNAHVMSWYWRAPAKGKRPLGRRYLSTNQAFMALERQLKPNSK